ncbi:DUF2490 domain-containing protein [Sphingobium vermicomposti]|uniref:DUF2490 domain-containing protein n=1 Tax=Sphingobium vermicomposti TaxID=529005 RepID=A0A846M4V3_9SPHN|nr:DUF2490 domain-containing protein [Sphingobium vermicomposti]NIJ15114.1 hypothetical protein [Sphingobium vermicomposti]
MIALAAARRSLLLLAFLSLTISPVARATEEESQLWLGASATMKASPRDMVIIDVGHRFRRDESNGDQQLARIALDHSVAKNVQIGGGIAYFHSEPEQELRLFQQLTATHGILQNRIRLEQRFFDTADEASWRLRHRIQATVPLDSARRWTLIAANELFFHLNRAKPSDKTGVAVMRQQAGLRHALGKALDVQLLYMRQQGLRDDRPDAVVHVPWLTLNWKI